MGIKAAEGTHKGDISALKGHIKEGYVVASKHIKFSVKQWTLVGWPLFTPYVNQYETNDRITLLFCFSVSFCSNLKLH